MSDLSQNVDGLSDRDAAKLQRVLEGLASRTDNYDEKSAKLVEGFEKTGDAASEGPGADPSGVVDDLQTLSDNGFEGFIDAGGTPQSVYKGVAGESDIATTLLERPDVDASDLEMNRDVPDVTDAPRDATEIDVDANVELTVDGKTLDSPAIESKYWTVGDKDEFVIESEMIAGKNPLVDQLETQLKSNDVDNEVVVVFPETYDIRAEELGLKQVLRQKLDNRLNSEYTVEFTTYEEIG